MKKMLITSLAAVSVAGLIGGGTFAGWTATDTTAADMEAGFLEIEVGPGADQFTNFGRMIPGGTNAFMRKIVAMDGSGRPPSGLESTLSFGIDASSVTESENACGGDEEVVDTDCATVDDGELYANLVITAFKLKDPASSGDPSLCEGTDTDVASFPSYVGGPLSAIEGGVDVDSTVNIGDELCLVFSAGLPGTAGNETQTDGVTFDFVYKLTQNV